VATSTHFGRFRATEDCWEIFTLVSYSHHAHFTDAKTDVCKCMLCFRCAWMQDLKVDTNNDSAHACDDCHMCVDTTSEHFQITAYMTNISCGTGGICSCILPAAKVPVSVGSDYVKMMSRFHPEYWRIAHAT